MRLVLFFALLIFGGYTSASAAECANPEAIKAFEAGQTLLRSGDTEAGIAKIEQAVSLYPDFNEAYEILEDLYGQLGRYDDAIRVTEHLMRLNPGDYEYEFAIIDYRSLAAMPKTDLKALERCQSYEVGSKEAIAACKEAIRLQPTYANAHYSLGVNFIYADDEEGAKNEIAVLMPIDPVGAGPLLMHVMADMKPEWWTEEYGKEADELLVALRTAKQQVARKESEYLRFTDQEIDQILHAYEEQIAAIRTLLEEYSDMGAAESTYKESRQIQEQLNTLSFVRIHAERGSPRNPPWFMYDFFDETREFMAKNQMVYSPYCFITKIGTDLDVGGQERRDWRVGLCQIWIERQYCQPDCTAMLEFRVDAEIGGELHQFKVRIQLLDEIAEIGQCFGSFGESPMLDW